MSNTGLPCVTNLPVGAKYVRARCSTFNTNAVVASIYLSQKPVTPYVSGVVGLNPGGQSIGSLGAGNTRIGYDAAHGVWWDESVAPLGSAARFDGTTRDLVNNAAGSFFASAAAFAKEFRALAISDVPGKLFIEVSRDNGVTWRRAFAATAVQADPTDAPLYVAEIVYTPATRYARAVYLNGGTAQGHFTLQTLALAA